MDLKYEEKMREKFCNLLKELSKSQVQLKNNNSKNKYYRQLEYLYHPNSDLELFRHYYSDIFSILTSLSEDCSVDVLGQNLSILYSNYDKYKTAKKTV